MLIFGIQSFKTLPRLLFFCGMRTYHSVDVEVLGQHLKVACIAAVYIIPKRPGDNIKFRLI